MGWNSQSKRQVWNYQSGGFYIVIVHGFLRPTTGDCRYITCSDTSEFHYNIEWHYIMKMWCSFPSQVLSTLIRAMKIITFHFCIREKRDRILPKSVDEMPKYTEKSTKVRKVNYSFRILSKWLHGCNSIDAFNIAIPIPSLLFKWKIR